MSTDCQIKQIKCLTNKLGALLLTFFFFLNLKKTFKQSRDTYETPSLREGTISKFSSQVITDGGREKGVSAPYYLWGFLCMHKIL